MANEKETKSAEHRRMARALSCRSFSSRRVVWPRQPDTLARAKMDIYTSRRKALRRHYRKSIRSFVVCT